MSTELSTVQHAEPTELSLANKSTFDHIQRVASLFAASKLVPTSFQGSLPDCVLAIEMASRMGASPFAVIQNLNIIHGRPSFSSQFLIAAINTCGRFLPLRYHLEGEGDERICIAWTIEKAVARMFGERLGKLITLPLARAQSEVPYLEGAPVSIAMAKAEGWFSKNGSKWKTMPDLMMRYRAAAFFARLYAPEIAMGIRPTEEVIDIEGEVTTAASEAPAVEPKKEQTVPVRKRTGVAKAMEKPAEIVVEAEPPKPAAETVLTSSPAADSAPSVDEEIATQANAGTLNATMEAAAQPAAPAVKEEPKPEAPEIKVRKITAEITRAVQRTPEGKAPYCEVELSGKDYTGPAFFLGTIDKLPDVGVVAEIGIEAKESAKKPGTFAQFIHSA